MQAGTLVLDSPGNDNQSVSFISGVSSGATLQMGSNAGDGEIYGGISNMDGTFDLNGMTESVVGLNGTGTITNTAAGTTGTLIFGWSPYYGSTGSDTFGGNIVDGAGAVALAVSGGSLTLTGTNTYSGDTTISDGTLVLGNSLAAQDSTVNIGSGGVLGFGSLLTTATVGGLEGNGDLTLPSGLTLTVGGDGPPRLTAATSAAAAA